jgi:hypothetical protein
VGLEFVLDFLFFIENLALDTKDIPEYIFFVMGMMTFTAHKPPSEARNAARKRSHQLAIPRGK